MALDPATLSAIIYGGAALTGAGAQITATGKLNKKNRQWQEDMYNKQVENNRQDALTAFQRQQQLIDDQRQFELQTSDPAFQMQRLEAAGINPDLMHGQISPAVNTPSVPSVASASPASVQPFQLDNPMAALPGALDSIANTMNNIISARAKNANIMEDTKLKGKQQQQIEEAINKLQSDKALTDAQKDKIIAETENLRDYLINVRPKELRKFDDESKQAAADLKATLQQIDQLQQIFPEQLATIQQNLKILKDNVHISAKQRELFDKEYDDLMSRLQDIFKLNRITLDNAINTANASSLQSQLQSDIVDQVKQIYDSIDPDEDNFSKITKFLMGAMTLWIQKELSSMPSAYDMYHDAQQSRQHQQDFIQSAQQFRERMDLEWDRTRRQYRK